MLDNVAASVPLVATLANHDDAAPPAQLIKEVLRYPGTTSTLAEEPGATVPSMKYVNVAERLTALFNVAEETDAYTTVLPSLTVPVEDGCVELDAPAIV